MNRRSGWSGLGKGPSVDRRRIATSALMFAGLWWMLSSGSAQSWILGLPVVCIATLTYVTLVPAFSCSVVGSMRFLRFFLWHSLLGAIDVAWRAFHPGLPIFPGVVEFSIRLPKGLPRVCLVNTISLLPGTLGMELRANRLQIHVLDLRKAVWPELMRLEQLVARMFEVSLDCDAGASSEAV
ncbi:Na+/H+ antiporter subunit E [Ferrimonas kyonanensis]|uniref:Na+/H+ antiporter subunit E n=1 Tax=Ferrimonas kyonanensis TaxID=364763 RepID=UPI000481979D|nr:Na+/H+ antiporter subunit E [Ferrimonas kyonanensis]